MYWNGNTGKYKRCIGMETQENIKGVLEWKHRKIKKVYWNGNTGKYKRCIGIETQ